MILDILVDYLASGIVGKGVSDDDFVLLVLLIEDRVQGSQDLSVESVVMSIDHRANEHGAFLGRNMQIELGIVKLIIGCSLRLKLIILFEDLRQ